MRHLAPEGKDLLGVPEGQLTDLRKAQVATHSIEQLHSLSFLQLADLGADRRRRDIQRIACMRDPALASHNPEVVQVVVVERGHDEPLSFGKYEESIRSFCLVHYSTFA
jgi:hypothetical protein